nr:DNA recombination protein RecO [Bacillus cereus]
MIWLILFLPAVIVWACVLFIHVKSGKSNHQYHEPLIFYSQRVSPFRVEHSKNNYKDDIEKSYRNDSFFLFTHLLTYSILLFAYPLLSKR